MAVAVSRATLNSVFEDTIERLKEWRDNHYKANLLLEPRLWQLPGATDGGSGDPHDLDSYSTIFNRQHIDKEYNTCITEVPPGTVGDGQSLRHQGDYVAMVERAVRTRHCSPIRAVVHEAARNKGLASDTGVLNAWTLRYLDNLIRVGKRDLGSG